MFLKGGGDVVASNLYELYFLLLRLKSATINFEYFLKRAKKWAKGLPKKPKRSLHEAIFGGMQAADL